MANDSRERPSAGAAPDELLVALGDLELAVGRVARLAMQRREASLGGAPSEPSESATVAAIHAFAASIGNRVGRGPPWLPHDVVAAVKAAFAVDALRGSLPADAPPSEVNKDVYKSPPEVNSEVILTPREIVETRDLVDVDYRSGHISTFWRERVIAMLHRIERVGVASRPEGEKP